MPPDRADRIRVVLATRALLAFTPSWRAAALAIAELGCVAFFAAGISEEAIGSAAPWYVLAAVLIGVCVRAVDVEACSLFVRGGTFGLVREALGELPGRVAASALLVERLLLGSLVAAAAGRYGAGLFRAGFAPQLSPAAAENTAVAVAVGLLAVVWLGRRRGRLFTSLTVSKAVIGAGSVLVFAIIWALLTLAGRGGMVAPLPFTAGAPATPMEALLALGSVMFVIGGVDTLSQIAPELEPPRILNLKRTAGIVAVFSVLVTASLGFFVSTLVPPGVRDAFLDTPIVGLTLSLAGPSWFKGLMTTVVAIGAVLMMLAAARSALAGAQLGLTRLVDDGMLPAALRAPHPQYGTPWRIVNITAAAQIAVVALSGGHVGWLSRAYAVGIAWSAVLKILAVVRLRKTRASAPAFRAPGSVHVAGRDWAVMLYGVAALIAVPAALLVPTLDPGSMVGTGLVVGLAAVIGALGRRSAAAGGAKQDLDEVQLLPSEEVDLRHVEARPGNLLVPVRKPHAMMHLAAALADAGDRDIVVMTARLVGIDVADEHGLDRRVTEEESHLFAAVTAVAERYGRAVRLLIAPGVNVFDAVVETAVRLQSSEIHVGESEVLPARDQARLLGEAWERAAGQKQSDVRVFIHHPSGRTAAFYLGPHAPTLAPEDLGHIHRLWLDVAGAVGPHVHHRDVVRTALKLMEQQLNGPGREETLAAVRETARPADELAAMIRKRDFVGLRDMVRNRTAGDLAEVLTDLPVEDRVLFFRTIPRKEAAAAFEYLEPEAQAALLKAMASEEVAALLNDMAPDDRTMFLEELPASATRQLLSLLTPEERAIAVTLLGYPERSIGRLMTPNYIAVREHWTVQYVLDYIRTHGQNSETLNVIYVVDERNALVDDIPIREFLLTSQTATVKDLMDRRFVALKATDAQETAVTVFRREDRSALPVTDSAGVLIGIVTVDDVLDVAEAAATEDIQRVGGSEALDEPYMEIAFRRMVQKRAGWLTALFIGEMLTATAMGAFEHEIERAVVLALFVPLIISSGGNSGSQASTLVIRALALGEVKLTDWWKVMRREIGAGLALGSILGTIGFLRITIWSTFSTIYGEHWLLVALTVAVALIGVVLWGTLIGSLLPFLLRRLGFDPAASSAPFVATLVDVTGLVIYFSVGIVILRGTLL
ncbi:MAG TPA: magnesium transporter [Vicinamibacterales bacterium]